MQQEDQTAAGKAAEAATSIDRDVALWQGLSGQLLVLTIVFVMIAEVLIFVPSIANFRNVWLQNHLDMAESASIVFLDTDDPMLSERAQAQLLKSTGSLAVVVREGPTARLMASVEMPEQVDMAIDLQRITPWESIMGALGVLVSSETRTYRVFGPMRSTQATIELVQDDRRLRNALIAYSSNVLFLSLAISLITAALVFLALWAIIVRPIRRISHNMTAFSRDPDNAALILTPTGRRDEIGVAEMRLASFQRQLSQTLRQRQHLADLGLAVSKINHDLRNILAAAQLFTDRLSVVQDPAVQRVAPKLLRAVNRAIDYTRAVLAYGKATEAPPDRRRFDLAALVDDVADLTGAEAQPGLQWANEVPRGFEMEADPEQMLRVLVNLCRNAAQALARTDDERERRLSVSAQRGRNAVCIRVADTGPGIGARAQENLFKAFGASSGGTGLGLAIAAELVRAHGGRIALETTSAQGTVFLVEVPVNGGAPMRRDGKLPAL